MGKKFKGVKGFDVYTARTELMDKRTPKDEDWFLEQDKVDTMQAFEYQKATESKVAVERTY